MGSFVLREIRGDSVLLGINFTNHVSAHIVIFARFLQHNLNFRQ